MKGQELYSRARQMIPGGNMLLSKRPEMFLPEKWPVYFERAKGCHVWDLDGRKLVDVSLMSVGTNLLGYGHEEVDAAVMRIVSLGNMSTLNAPEEVFLAEKLLALHPWAQKIRFARTGGEANAIAVRIARAFQGGSRSKVAFCGYHGWHDWYLAANLGAGDSLDGQLLPGLDPAGVPVSLEGSAFPFTYGDLNRLEALLLRGDIGVVKMEVARSSAPDVEFLQGVRHLTQQHGATLIFDECTSGFRECLGGLHKKISIAPDMAMFGKALGNGYAVTAILGRSEVMSAAQNSFISSTFWTERIGSSAGLATLEVMERDKSWETVSNAGAKVRSAWIKLAEKYSLPMTHSGLDALASFAFASPNNAAYKTLISQEMLKRGYLASNCFYASTAHSDEIILEYLDNLDDVFELVAQCENGRPINDLLDGPVCHTGFQRLN